MNAGAGFNKADVGGGNDGGRITASLRIEGAKCDAACRKGLHGLAERGPVPGGIAEAVRSLTKIVRGATRGGDDLWLPPPPFSNFASSFHPAQQGPDVPYVRGTTENGRSNQLFVRSRRFPRWTVHSRRKVEKLRAPSLAKCRGDE
jgi:hypothetical protein